MGLAAGVVAAASGLRNLRDEGCRRELILQKKHGLSWEPQKENRSAFSECRLRSKTLVKL